MGFMPDLFKYIVALQGRQYHQMKCLHVISDQYVQRACISCSPPVLFSPVR